MRLFVMVFFWLGVFMFCARVIAMTVYDWPHPQKPTTLGMQVAQTLIGLAATAWAGFVLWALR